METRARQTVLDIPTATAGERIAGMWRGLHRLAAGWGGTPFPSMLSEVRDLVEDAKLRRAEYLRQPEAPKAQPAGTAIAFVEPASEASRF